MATMQSMGEILKHNVTLLMRGGGGGVPFYIRVGKCLPVDATEVLVELRRPPQRVFGTFPMEHVMNSVEQAATFGWARFTGLGGERIGMRTFGASAPLKALQKKFGFTVENVVAAAKRQWQKAR